MSKFQEFKASLTEAKKEVTIADLEKALNVKADKNAVITLTKTFKGNTEKSYLRVSDAYGGSVNSYLDYDGHDLDATYKTIKQTKSAMYQSGMIN